MVDKVLDPVLSKSSKKALKIQGNTALDILLVIVVILTVFGFMVTMIFGGNDAGTTTTNTATARSAPVSSTTTYPYNQPATTYSQTAQPTYSQNYNQATNQSFQGRAGFNSVPGDINSANVAASGIAGATVGAGIGSAGVATTQVIPQVNNQVNTQVNAQQTIGASGAYGVGLNGEIIGLNPIQPLGVPNIPTTAQSTSGLTGRSVLTQGSNPAAPFTNTNNNAAIYIEEVQAYRPQNQELIMNQACVNEVWQRNPYVIRNFSNLSVRLSATNPIVNGNMRTYSFNLDNRPTGNGALCTVTTDGYVTAVSFY